MQGLIGRGSKLIAINQGIHSIYSKPITPVTLYEIHIVELVQKLISNFTINRNNIFSVIGVWNKMKLA